MRSEYLLRTLRRIGSLNRQNQQMTLKPVPTSGRSKVTSSIVITEILCTCPAFGIGGRSSSLNHPSLGDTRAALQFSHSAAARSFFENKTRNGSSVEIIFGQSSCVFGENHTSPTCVRGDDSARWPNSIPAGGVARGVLLIPVSSSELGVVCSGMEQNDGNE